MRRDRDWERVADLFRAGVDAEGTYEVDDRTWGDLGLNAVVDRVDRTLTVMGEQVLYARLRRPSITGDSLASRRKLVDWLEQNPPGLEVLRRELAALGCADGDHLAEMVWRTGDRLPFSRWVYRLAALTATGMIAVAFFVHALAGVVGVVAMLLLNIWLHGRARMSSSGDMRSVRYLSRFLRTVHRLGRCERLPPDDRELLARLGRESRPLRRRLTVQRVLSASAVDEILGTINVFFLIEARAYASAFGEIGRLRPLLKEVFLRLGALDCAQSIRAWRDELSVWAEPVLSEDARRPAVVDLGHVLLDQPVACSVALEGGGLVVTGSNMSGKSTFLRSLGTAAILAQSLGTVTARSYGSGFLEVRSVMSGADDLLARKSYYLDEAQAVLRTLRARGEGAAVLCIFDELFRGTNSAERIAAGVSVVRWLVGRGSVVVLATHDLQAAMLLDGPLVNVHFRDQIDERGITFDHRLRPGLAERTNALDVLAHVGYPAAVVEEGRRIAQGLAVERVPGGRDPTGAAVAVSGGTAE